LAFIAAFLPESDSEDELSPGWEERATVQGTLLTILSYTALPRNLFSFYKKLRNCNKLAIKRILRVVRTCECTVLYTYIEKKYGDIFGREEFLKIIWGKLFTETPAYLSIFAESNIDSVYAVITNGML